MSKIFADVGGATTANDGMGFDKWMQRLLVRFAGAPDSLIRAELIDAVREFYKESNAWREHIGPYHVYAGNDLVWVNPVDSYSEAIYVRHVWLQEDGGGMTPLLPLTARRTEARSGKPTHYSLADPYVIRLWPTPDVGIGPVLWLDATLCPLPDATRFPNIALSHHFDAILNGAISRILAIPNKPWTDFALAMRMSQLFRRDTVRFRAQSEQGYTSSDPGWRFPVWA